MDELALRLGHLPEVCGFEFLDLQFFVSCLLRVFRGYAFSLTGVQFVITFKTEPRNTRKGHEKKKGCSANSSSRQRTGWKARPTRNGQAGKPVLHYLDMPRQSEHIKEFDGLFFYVRKNHTGAGSSRGIDDAEEDRDADAIHDLGLRKVYDELLAAFVQTSAAFALDLFAGQFVEVVAGKHNGAFIVRIRG